VGGKKGSSQEERQKQRGKIPGWRGKSSKGEAVIGWGGQASSLSTVCRRRGGSNSRGKQQELGDDLEEARGKARKAVGQRMRRVKTTKVFTQKGGKGRKT